MQKILEFFRDSLGIAVVMGWEMSILTGTETHDNCPIKEEHTDARALEETVGKYHGR